MRNSSVRFPKRNSQLLLRCPYCVGYVLIAPVQYRLEQLVLRGIGKARNARKCMEENDDHDVPVLQLLESFLQLNMSV
jgi:hypothetical protein